MQTEKPSRTYRREDEWRALVNEYEASGVSAKKFCAQHNIATSGLYSWRKKFQAQLSEASSPFIELITPADHQNTATWNVELELGSGAVLRIRTANLC